MTEKRFEYKNHKVFDNLTGETHSSNMVSVNVLNALHEENEQLKLEYKVLHTQYQDLKRFVENNFDEYLTQEKLNGQIIKLSDENEKLKSEINMLKNTISRNEVYIKKLTHESKWHN